MALDGICPYGFPANCCWKPATVTLVSVRHIHIVVGDVMLILELVVPYWVRVQGRTYFAHCLPSAACQDFASCQPSSAGSRLADSHPEVPCLQIAAVVLAVVEVAAAAAAAVAVAVAVAVVAAADCTSFVAVDLPAAVGRHC